MPFVLTYNYAADKLSEIEVGRLPPFGLEKQIVLLHSSDRSVQSQNYHQESRAKPGVVLLLQWDLFLERLSNTPIVKSSYSNSFESSL